MEHEKPKKAAPKKAAPAKKTAAKGAAARKSATPKPKREGAREPEFVELKHLAEEIQLGESIGAQLDSEPPIAEPVHPAVGYHSFEAPHHVTAVEIGSHPVQEESRLTGDFRLWGPGPLDRAVFCRQLATLIEVGIPLVQALKMLSRQTPHPRLRKAVRQVARDVEEGVSLSTAVADHERTFSPLVVNAIRVGEAGGILEDSLIRLAQIMESKAEIRRKVISAMLYPIIVLCVALLMITLILTKAVPIFAQIYAEAGVQLPKPTMLVIAASHAASNPVVWILVFVIFAVLIILGSTPQGKHVRAWISLHFPIVGSIARRIAVARFSRTTSGLLSAGVPLIECLEIAADTNENVIVSEALHRVQHAVERGERMSKPMAEARIFPTMVVDMIAVGEETGTLDVMLAKIAEIYDADVDATLRGLSTIVEPLLLVLIGGIIFFIALAVVLPYFSMATIVV